MLEDFGLRRQLFTEHALTAVCGGSLGALLAHALVQRLISSEAAHLPRPDAIRFDAPVFWVMGGIATLIAIVLAAQPLQRQSAVLRTGLRAAGGSDHRARRFLVGTEIALAVTLTTAGALLALSLFRLLAVDPGFAAEGAAAARVSAYEAEYRTKDDVVRMFDNVLERLRLRPDVRFAGAGSSLPLSGASSGTSVVAQGRPVLPGARPTAGWQFITPGYVAATGMRLRVGRDFSDVDRARDAHVTIINEDLARMLFPGENPLGRRIGVGGGDAQDDWHEIIGVVADVKHQSLDAVPSPRVYDLFGQHWGRTMYVVARAGTGEPAPLINVMRSEVADLNPNVPVFESATLKMLVDRSAAQRRLASLAASGLALAGLLLALIGVHAVTAASVVERTREIGVRAALGAAPRDLFRLVAREGVVSAVCGAAAGLIASAMVTRLLTNQLFGIDALDAAWVVALVAGCVVIAAMLAIVPPGRRAATANPLVAMRYQ